MENINYKVIFSKRRTLALIIEESGALLIKAPRLFSKRKIEEIVNEKRPWIIKKISERKKLLKKYPSKKLISGETFIFLGKSYSLETVDKGLKKIIFQEKFYLPNYSYKKRKKLFEDWYKEKAKELFFERVNIYASKMNIKYQNLRISNAKKRWGSCTSRGKVSLSWRLIMAPLEIIDYVIIHELFHIIELNHSNNFWKGIEEIYPSYKKAKLWLRKNGQMLNI